MHLIPSFRMVTITKKIFNKLNSILYRYFIIYLIFAFKYLNRQHGVAVDLISRTGEVLSSKYQNVSGCKSVCNSYLKREKSRGQGTVPAELDPQDAQLLPERAVPKDCVLRSRYVLCGSNQSITALIILQHFLHRNTPKIKKL